MAKSYGTSVKVDLVLGDAKNLHVGECNNAEGLVDLESVDGGDVNLGVLQGLRHGQRRRGGELGRVLLSVTPAKDLADGLQAVLLDSLFRSEDEGRRAVGERRGVRSGDGTILLEGRTKCAGLGLVELQLVSIRLLR